mgnify:CR=1 FL=1
MEKSIHMNHQPNDPNLTTWVNVPPNSDFPIQNLPFGIFSDTEYKAPRAGVAIGDQVIDLAALFEQGHLNGLGLPEDNVFAYDTLNAFMALGKQTASKVRTRVSQLLLADNPELRDNEELKQAAMRPMDHVTMHMPVFVRDYTDFYSSIEHATNVGTMFRDPNNALLPNWRHLPVGYHGRASSIVPSGTPITRPKGQYKDPQDDQPSFGPSRRLDFELEMAFITCKENGMGNSVSTAEAEEYIFGFVLFNDWSARDIQAWEYQPLGPFLGKNFGSSISPWIVTMDALEPFRTESPKQEPEVLPYLKTEGKKAFDIELEVFLHPEGGNENKICHSNFKYLYWNVNQQLAHHTVNGCNLGIGDMYASGTISGSDPKSFGSMLELAWKGTKPLKLDDGSERKFLLDGDTVTMRAYAEGNGVRIGFGEVSSKILPAK